MTWAEINSLAQSGYFEKLFSVGDTKNLVVGDETLAVEIIGFNHDVLTTGSRAKVTFATKYLMREIVQMNNTNNINSGFASTNLAHQLIDIKNSLPVDLRNVLKIVNKECYVPSTDSISYWSTYIFVLSFAEVYGTSYVYDRAPRNEGSQYARFTSSESRIKKLSNDAGESMNWWLRSPEYKNPQGVVSVQHTSGVPYINFLTNRGGVCFAFCI